MLVCIPGLHLSLGIYNRLWTLLEEACHELDFEVATCDIPTSSSDPSTSSFKQLSLLNVELETQKNEAIVLSEMLTFSTLTMEDPYNSHIYESFDDLAKIQKTICDKVYKCRILKKKMH